MNWLREKFSNLSIILRPPLFLVVVVSLVGILSCYNLIGFGFNSDNHHQVDIKRELRIETLQTHLEITRRI